jgi:hypothetical protein
VNFVLENKKEHVKFHCVKNGWKTKPKDFVCRTIRNSALEQESKFRAHKDINKIVKLFIIIITLLYKIKIQIKINST